MVSRGRPPPLLPLRQHPCTGGSPCTSHSPCGREQGFPSGTPRSCGFSVFRVTPSRVRGSICSRKSPPPAEPPLTSFPLPDQTAQSYFSGRLVVRGRNPACTLREPQSQWNARNGYNRWDDSGGLSSTTTSPEPARRLFPCREQGSRAAGGIPQPPERRGYAHDGRSLYPLPPAEWNGVQTP